MSVKRADLSFVQKGFSYRKDAIIAFKKHEPSECNKEAVQVSVVLPRTCLDVGEMLSSQHAKEKKENRECLLKILSNLKFLAHQAKLKLHLSGALFVGINTMCIAFTSLFE